MGYFLRARMTSFFAGAATSSSSSLWMYLLYKDYNIAQESISQKMKGFQESLEGRISALEKLREFEALEKVEATD